MNRQKYPLRVLRNNSSEVIEIRDREHKIIIGDMDVQYWKTFKKSKAEKLQLKVAKAQTKISGLVPVRGCRC